MKNIKISTAIYVVVAVVILCGILVLVYSSRGLVFERMNEAGVFDEIVGREVERKLAEVEGYLEYEADLEDEFSFFIFLIMVTKGCLICILNFFKDVVLLYIMKRVILLLALFCFVFVSADSVNDDLIAERLEDVTSAVGERAGDIGRNSGEYAEVLGKYLLKFQDAFMGALSFISLGFFNVGEDMAFITFLFFILLFMLIYGIVGFAFKKFNFGIAFIITLLAFIGMPEEGLRAIMLNYEAMGVTITVILPILILLSFTFRIYYRAWNGESKTSPVYAEIFNFFLLCWFGWYFIRHSYSEEGAIAVMRYVSGIFLIGMGISQVVFFKFLARVVHNMVRENKLVEKAMRKMNREAVEAIDKARLGELGGKME